MLKLLRTIHGALILKTLTTTAVTIVPAPQALAMAVTRRTTKTNFFTAQTQNSVVIQEDVGMMILMIIITDMMDFHSTKIQSTDHRVDRAIIHQVEQVMTRILDQQHFH